MTGADLSGCKLAKTSKEVEDIWNELKESLRQIELARSYLILEGCIVLAGKL